MSVQRPTPTPTCPNKQAVRAFYRQSVRVCVCVGGEQLHVETAQSSSNWSSVV